MVNVHSLLEHSLGESSYIYDYAIYNYSYIHDEIIVNGHYW